jgi:3-oxoacyl-(acyl-carrier-protein) synthase
MFIRNIEVYTGEERCTDRQEALNATIEGLRSLVRSLYAKALSINGKGEINFRFACPNIPTGEAKDFLRLSPLNAVVADILSQELSDFDGSFHLIDSACESTGALLETGMANLALRPNNLEILIAIEAPYPGVYEYQKGEVSISLDGSMMPFSADADGPNMVSVCRGVGVIASSSGDSGVPRILSVARTTDFHPRNSVHGITSNGYLTAMRRAIQRSGLKPDGVEVVVPHGTATKMNDEAELAATRDVLGESVRFLPLKGKINHGVVAAGFLDLAYFLEHEAGKTALFNVAGFGGHYASFVVAR